MSWRVNDIEDDIGDRNCWPSASWPSVGSLWVRCHTGRSAGWSSTGAPTACPRSGALRTWSSCRMGARHREDRAVSNYLHDVVDCMRGVDHDTFGVIAHHPYVVVDVKVCPSSENVPEMMAWPIRAIRTRPPSAVRRRGASWRRRRRSHQCRWFRSRTHQAVADPAGRGRSAWGSPG